MRIWDRIKAVNGDLSAHLSDLVILLGYLSVGIYAGGYQYITSYNKFFALPVKPDAANLSTFVAFVENVLINKSITVTAFILLLFVIVISINFVARNLFRIWLSYLVVSSIAVISIVVFVIIGSNFGWEQAKFDISKKSDLPVIEIRILVRDECFGSLITGTNVRLLFRDSAFIYFFEPVDSVTSEIIIDSISSACVAGVRLTRQGM